ncbi:phytanoyl-CoA dioxygenase family protein [Marinomonas mediterranea]|uniref:phytanoyl-CoA dioxygenase family protein n=1 Tax=Marinomonas mediterranea TaxID=119864 RepID=UPI0023491863|nr:phytanoyl-CoA dioxygenase family protein [Marinomonas mediterranea]WCN07620.1 phytanoyl-CoA dioxygenase family protein [Marinomonas mediterranea]
MFGQIEIRLNELTPEQIAQYHEQGFLVIEGAVSSGTCDLLKSRINERLEEFDPNSIRSIFTTKEQDRQTDDYFLKSAERISYFFEEEAFDEHGELRQDKVLSINKIGHALHDKDELFADFSLSPIWATILKQLGMKKPLAAQSMYIFKQPNIGGEVNCHQDSTFLFTRPMSVIGLWFAIEDATLENGCLWGVPQGHKQGLEKRFERVSEGESAMKMTKLSDVDWPDEALVPLEVPKGSMVVLNGEFPHLSHANRSAQSRHAYALHAIDGDCEYPKTNWLLRHGRTFPEFRHNN